MCITKDRLALIIVSIYVYSLYIAPFGTNTRNISNEWNIFGLTADVTRATSSPFDLSMAFLDG